MLDDAEGKALPAEGSADADKDAEADRGATVGEEGEDAGDGNRGGDEGEGDGRGDEGDELEAEYEEFETGEECDESSERAEVREGSWFLRWGLPAALVSLPFVAAFLVVAWLAGVFDSDHPFGDDRACSGSDVPLQKALRRAGIRLPSDATDVHYVTHSFPQPGQYDMAVEFRSSRRQTEAFLTQEKLVQGNFDDLADGRFATGDGDAPGDLCVPAPQAPAVTVTRNTGNPGLYGTKLDVNVALNGQWLIPLKGIVLITFTANTGA